jgi:hypothetical protein
MFRPDAGFEAAVFPGVFLVETAVVAAFIVAYPVTPVVDVRTVGMVGLVAVIAVLLGSPGIAAIGLRTTLRGRRHALRRCLRPALVMFVFMFTLRKCGDGKRQQSCQRQGDWSHFYLLHLQPAAGDQSGRRVQLQIV